MISELTETKHGQIGAVESSNLVLESLFGSRDCWFFLPICPLYPVSPLQPVNMLKILLVTVSRIFSPYFPWPVS